APALGGEEVGLGSGQRPQLEGRSRRPQERKRGGCRRRILRARELVAAEQRARGFACGRRLEAAVEAEVGTHSGAKGPQLHALAAARSMRTWTLERTAQDPG